ncbi:hypothetical protein IT399_00065 [Candidatus Nomurabacteria bacterium]|nr:hypothetical protein [Candidatus Nomurabacteria bacterium]
MSLENPNNKKGGEENKIDKINFNTRKAVALGVLATTLSTSPLPAQEKFGAEVESEVGRPPISKDSSARHQAKALEGLTGDADDILESYKKYDKQREWLINIVYSKVYEDKLIKYEGFTKADVEIRKKRVLRDIDLVEPSYSGDDIPKGKDGVYWFNNEKTIIRAGRHPSLFIHEGEHATTDANLHMSVYADNLYKQVYVGPSDKTEEGEYLSSPTEMDARKRSLEYELERFGLWKYGEPFTKKHLRKILKLAKDKKLYHDAAKFLEITNPQYPQYPQKAKTIKNILLIMNTIA